MRDGRRSMGRRRLLGAVLAAGLAVSTAAACGGGDDSGSGDGALKGQKLTVAAIWTGSNEGAKFQKVLDEFEKRTGAEVTYTPTGDNVAAYLGSKVEGNAPPDVAFLPQQGVLVEFAEKGWIKPLPDEAKSLVQQNFAKVWQDLGSHEGTVYGVYFKASSKSTVWYRKQAFADAGITTPPASWDDFVKTAQTLSDAGTTPISVGAADGWVLTDWFENIYLRVAGAERYDQLARHEIPWTHPTVVESLTLLQDYWSADRAIQDDPLQLKFVQAVADVFGPRPKSSMLFEGDFVAAEIIRLGMVAVGDGAAFFDWPSIHGSPPAVVTAGDQAVAFTNRPVTMALIAFLASPEAAEIAARRGGFLSANQGLDPAAYPDPVTRELATSLRNADVLRFDLSDLTPQSFGGGTNAEMWRLLQGFLADGGDPQQVAEQLEAAAQRAFRSPA